MSKVISESSAYWNNVYNRFHQSEHSRQSVWNESPTPFFEKMIPFLKYRNVEKVMDAGCGDGRNLTPLIQAGFHVVGVDSSNKAIKYSRKNNPQVKNLTLLRCNLDNIALNPESLDTIICDHVLTHIQDVGSVLNQFHALLRNKGYALLEFTSCQDSTFGKGTQISEKEFLQNGVYLRYDEPEDFCALLQDNFDILCFSSEHSTDPPHGKGYIRKKRHAHHSYFVIAMKK